MLNTSWLKEYVVGNNKRNIAIKLCNTEFNKKFTVTVKMNKLFDGIWRIKEIVNLVDFLLEVYKVQKEKII